MKTVFMCAGKKSIGSTLVKELLGSVLWISYILRVATASGLFGTVTGIATKICQV